MKKILLLVLTMVFAFTCALSASANPYGGVPIAHTFPAGMTGFCVYLRPVGVRQPLWRRAHRPHVPCGHDAGRNPGVFPP